MNVKLAFLPKILHEQKPASPPHTHTHNNRSKSSAFPLLYSFLFSGLLRRVPLSRSTPQNILRCSRRNELCDRRALWSGTLNNWSYTKLLYMQATQSGTIEKCSQGWSSSGGGGGGRPARRLPGGCQEADAAPLCASTSGHLRQKQCELLIEQQPGAVTSS